MTNDESARLEAIRLVYGHLYAISAEASTVEEIIKDAEKVYQFLIGNRPEKTA